MKLPRAVLSCALPATEKKANEGAPPEGWVTFGLPATEKQAPEGAPPEGWTLVDEQEQAELAA